jgi:hypothetical protein
MHAKDSRGLAIKMYMHLRSYRKLAQLTGVSKSTLHRWVTTSPVMPRRSTLPKSTHDCHAAAARGPDFTRANYGKVVPAAGVRGGRVQRPACDCPAKQTRQERDYAMDIVGAGFFINGDISDDDLVEECEGLTGVHPPRERDGGYISWL